MSFYTHRCTPLYGTGKSSDSYDDATHDQCVVWCMLAHFEALRLRKWSWPTQGHASWNAVCVCFECGLVTDILDFTAGPVVPDLTSIKKKKHPKQKDAMCVGVDMLDLTGGPNFPKIVGRCEVLTLWGPARKTFFFKLNKNYTFISLKKKP